MSLSRVLLLGAALALAPVVGVARADEPTLEQLLVESASTPTQHRALANYYKSHAAAAKQEAERHRVMADTYSGTKLAQRQMMVEHCRKLAQESEAQASDYEKLAAIHEASAGK